MLLRLLLTICLIYYPVRAAVPTKVCADDACSIKLFTSTGNRDYEANHPNFISFKKDEPIEVFAIKMSNRVDISEGVNSKGDRGFFYTTHIKLEPYVFYLFSIVKQNTEMSEVTIADANTISKPVRKRFANPYLWRDYRKWATESGIPAEEIELLEDPEEKAKNLHGHHHHHHHHHDHSHGHGHDHHHHDHSHEHHNHDVPPTPNSVENKPPTPVTSTDKPQDAVPVPNKPQEAVPTPIEPQQAVPTPIQPQEAVTPPIKPQDPATPPIKPTPTVPVMDPLKQMSMNALNDLGKEQVKEVPPLEAPTATSAEGAPVRQPVPSQSAESIDAVPVASVPNPVPTEPVKLSPDMVNSIIGSVGLEDLPKKDLPSDSASVPVVPNPETVKAAIPVNSVPTPVPEVKIPSVPVEVPTTTATPPVEMPTTPVPADPQTVATPPPVEAVTTTLPPPVEIPTPTVPQLMELPTTTVPPPVEEIPTTTPLPPLVESPTTTVPTPIEVPVPTPAPLEAPAVPTPAPIDTPVTTPAAHPVDPAPSDPQKVFEEPPPGPAVSALHETVRERRGNNEMDEYCYKNDCSGLDSNGSVQPNSDAFIAAYIRPHAKTISSTVRNVMPYPVSDFDDTGVFVLFFLVCSLITYLMGMLLPDGAKRDILDRRTLHDSLTRIKELEVENKNLRAHAGGSQRAEQVQKENEQLHSEYQKINSLLNSARQNVQQRETQVDELEAEKNRLQTTLDQTVANNESLEHQNKELDEKLALSRTQQNEINQRLTETVNELHTAHQKIDDLSSRLREAEDQSNSLQLSLESANNTVTSLTDQIEKGKQTEQSYLEMIAELHRQVEESQQHVEMVETKKETPAEEVGSGASSASNGWSDMDMADLDTAEEPKKPETEEKPMPKPTKVASLGKKNKSKEKEASPEQERKSSDASLSVSSSSKDIVALANLRVQLRAAEEERNDLAAKLSDEQKNRERIEASLERIKKELNDKETELTAFKNEFQNDKGSWDNAKKVLEDELKEQSQAAHRLLSEKVRLLEEKEKLSTISVEKRECEARIKELEREIRHLEEDRRKIETRYFQDNRRDKERISILEAELAKATLHSPLGNTVESGNSSERGFPGRTDVASLWSDLDLPETSYDERPLFDQRNDVRRRSGRDMVPPESGRRSATRRDSGAPRRRSRSAGRSRTGAPSPHYSGLGLPSHNSSRNSPYYDQYERPEVRRVSGRLSRGMGYVSSDGSSPRSPPPLLSRSGVPPEVTRPEVKLHKPTPK